MSTVFGGGQQTQPDAPKVVPLPNADDESVQMARKRKYAEIASSSGRDSTNLTRSLGGNASILG